MHIKNIIIIAVCALFISCKTYDKKPELQVKKQPNVLWLLTDDQRYDAVPTFNKILHGRENSELGYVESPEVDKLAQMGTTFISYNFV